MRRKITFALLPALVVFALASGACSDDDDSDNSDATAAGTATTEAHEEDGADLADAEVGESFTIEMRDFEFAPASLEVASGDVVAIAFSNTGSVTHDFTIEEADLDSMMMGEMEMVEGHSGDEHTAGMAMHVPLEMGHDATVRMRVHEPGEYVFYCTVPGHRDLGMEGTLHVN